MGESSGVLRFGIFLQIVSIVLALAAYFMNWYVMEVNAGVLDDLASVTSTVSLKLQEYTCDVSNTVESELSMSGTFSYTSDAGVECAPILTPTVQYTNLGNNMKVCLAFLILGIILNFATMFFQCIMNCQSTCRNCCMKIVTLIVSLTPAICLAISAFTLFAITTSFNIEHDIGSTSSDEVDLNICQLYWCNTFYGSDSGGVSLLANGDVSWKPAVGWFLTIISTFFALLACLVTLCTSRHKKPHHHGDHHFNHHYNPSDNYSYTRIVNQ